MKDLNMLSKQAGRQRKLQVVLGVLSLISVGLIVSTFYFGIQLKQKNDELSASSRICETRECVTAAGDMIKSMDFTAKPCEDFFQFSCGNWLKTNPIPDTASSWNQFNVLRDHLNRKIREILERKLDGNDPMPLNVAKTFYQSCLAQNTTSHQDLSDLISKLVDENSEGTEIGKKLGELRRYVAGNFIVSTSVSLDEENTTRHRVYVDQPTLGLNRIYLVQTPEHQYKTAYVELIEEIWEEVYPNAPNRNEIAKGIVHFETKLAEISTKPEDRRDRTKLYNPMSIAELSKLTENASMINWQLYFEETFRNATDDGIIDLASIKVIVRDIDYFKKFGEVLKEARDNSSQIITNYLKWRIILNYANDVSNKLRDILFNYSRKTQGTMYPPPRWQVCSDRANSLFGMAISYHYVQDVFTANFQRQMSEMIENIREAFYDILGEIDWFGEPITKLKAKEKAEKMLTFIGYPEWLLEDKNDHAALRNEYAGMPEEMSPDHFQNMLDLIEWKNVDNLKHINRRKDTSKWISDPTVVNAFYSSTYNSITFPGGILQTPFYFTGKPIQALNYGGIGMVIGHEITHGFDDRGRQSDGNGDLQDWWDEETVKQYTEKTKCFVDQYGNYTAEEADHMPLNGNNTLGENIADNGGLRQAFRAYLSFVEKNGAEPRLPGLEFSPEQLFFIAFSQIWCGAYTKQGMESQIKTGVHSPNRFRVKGVLHNSVEFAQVWNCPRPIDQCRIW